ncbi:MAG: hypothetical protein DRQ47_01885 [Gammaproteobacteria bacterium]|nr:MAG: hypothetical protein DRQ47_01885 [Gammaproteobacteria bacterium]
MAFIRLAKVQELEDALARADKLEDEGMAVANDKARIKLFIEMYELANNQSVYLDEFDVKLINKYRG